jgi:hypothetical protein
MEKKGKGKLESPGFNSGMLKQATTQMFALRAPLVGGIEEISTEWPGHKKTPTSLHWSGFFSLPTSPSTSMSDFVGPFPKESEGAEQGAASTYADLAVAK